MFLPSIGPHTLKLGLISYEMYSLRSCAKVTFFTFNSSLIKSTKSLIIALF